MASAPPPPPPPPPPVINNDSTNTNDPTSSIVQPTNNGAQTTSTDGTKSWERAWSVDEMRKGATNWSLASDAGLLLHMQEFSQNMLSQTHSMEQKVDGLVQETKGISAKVHNTFNNFLMLSNTQFIENRVYDEEETKDEEEKQGETSAPQEKEKTREELETEVIPKINEALQCGLAVLDSAFVTVEITPEQVSDDEDEGTLPDNLKPEPILELTDVYAHRKMPSFIGTAEFHKDDLVGLGESSSEDEGSDKEASMEESESESEKSTEDEETSESETVSGSESEEASSTATESEDEKEVVVKKKPRKESSGSESDDGLFAAGGTQKTRKSKEEEDDDDDDSEESMEEEDKVKEQPRKSAAPMDFSAELAAKLGVKPKTPVDDSDEDGDKDDWEESEKLESEAAKDDLFSASVDTTTTVSSKGSRRKKKHKKQKSRTGSHASHASHDSGTTAAVAAGNVTNDFETSQKHEDNDDDDLFTSSIDTTSSVVSKGSRSKHKHKTKTSRSDSQVSNASSKSSHKEKKTSSKDESSLFSGSPEGDLFDETSPFGKKGGMFSGGGGLFDDVAEDDEEISKSGSVDNSTPKSDHEKDESDEEIVKQKPRTASGKKLPAGAVAIFGNQGPFGHVPVQVTEHHVTKSSPVEKKETKPSQGGGLFSDEGDDIFTSSQTSSVVSNKPPAVAAKSTKSVDLFGPGDEEEDDDSLFGVKPTKKADPKADPPKKKLPAGAVSIFGSASPPPLFNTSDTKSPEVSPPSAPSTKINTKSSNEASGLFDDDDDKTSSFNSERSVASSTATKAAPPVQAKRKTNQISLFDDNDDDDVDDDDDLFASIAPSKSDGSNKSATISKPQPSGAKPVEVSKPAPKRSTISLFDDDDEEDDDEEDMFSIKPSAKSKPEAKPSVKPSAASPAGLFGSADDPLFSGEKPIANDVKNADNKPEKQESKVLHVDEPEEDDLFSEPKPQSAEEPAVNKPTKKEAEKQSEDLFEADSDEKDDNDGGKPARKILPGALPMFGGVDIFGGQKPGKTTKARPQGESLFTNDEEDLFATPPKPVPTVAPRAKPRKPAVETPTSSSPLRVSKASEEASSEKNTNVGKLQKYLMFNPTAMLPGARPPPKKQETTDAPVAARKPIIFNPATMLPGAVPPPRKQENSAEATFDKPASVKTLETSGRDRVRPRGNRRPPTRQARQKAAKESMDDASLFGSNLAVPTGGQPSLFSDSDDLFSSSSYKASSKNNQISNTTQSNYSKFDPLFIHNTMASDLPSFEDSVDSIPDDVAARKENASNMKKDKNKTDPLFSNPPKDDLFTTSTESDRSILPKPDVEKRVPNNQQNTTEKTKEKSKDDIFSVSTESESSILQQSQKRSDDDLLSQSHEIPKKTKPKKGETQNKKSKTDLLFDTEPKNDLFSQSTESNSSQRSKLTEKNSTMKSQSTKVDPLFDSQPKDDLFSQSTESNRSQKAKSTEKVSSTKKQKSKTDPLFDSRPKDDLFSQSADSDIVQKGKQVDDVSAAKSDGLNVDPLLGSKQNTDLFSKSTESDVPPKTEPDIKTKQMPESDPLFHSKPNDDLFSQSVESNVSQSNTSDHSAKKNEKAAPLLDNTQKDDIFNRSTESNKSSSQKVQIDKVEDDDEDDIFKPNNRALFSPPPLDFDSEVSASGEFTTQSNAKTISDDIFGDDDDIFAPKSTKKKDSENISEKTKVNIKDEKKKDIQEAAKTTSEVKKIDDVDDLFAGTESIFDDLPKKSKEKKKKKATTSKENIFDKPQDSVAGGEASTSKTAKKTKGKKKGKSSNVSIFDEDSPSIFDDPLNATSK